MERETFLKRLREEQQSVLEALKNTAAQFENAADLDESEARDIDDLSHQDEAKDMQMRYENLLAEAQATLDTLGRNQGDKSEYATVGSIVDLGGKAIYLGASVPAFDMGGLEVVGISADAPMYSQLEGKKAGDSVKIGQDTYKIREIL